jgi:hypothetical protein
MTSDRNRITKIARGGRGEDEIALDQTPHPCAGPGSSVGRGTADRAFVGLAPPATPWHALL